MARISNEDRLIYQEKAKSYRDAANAILLREKNLLQVLERDEAGAPHMRLNLVDEMLNLASIYMVIHGISWSMLGIKNEESLNDARKTVYKAIIYLEEVVSPFVDVPFSDYEANLARISTVDATKRYELVRKMGLTIRMLMDAYGENTKWKWAFVEIEGRFATVAKNLYDLKSAVQNLDPRSEYYETYVYHLRTIKKLLLQAADRYREKYEVSTNRIDDFKLAISYLLALRRIHVLLAERDEAEQIKKKAEIWQSKLEADHKKREAESR